MPAVHLKIYGAESDYTSKNLEFVDACNKRVLEMSDKEVDNLLEARRKQKNAIEGGNKTSGRNDTYGRSTSEDDVNEASKRTAVEVNRETVFTVRVDNSDAQILRVGLQDVTYDRLIDDIRVLVAAHRNTMKDAEIATVAVKFGWWSDEWLEYEFDSPYSFEFMLERIRRYDGSAGNCMVAFK
ncbi:MAG: hypothetical protein M1835_002918, partial [Candelina submexicana]